MTPADAAELLTLAASFDRRTVGEADARAWAAALHAIPLDDDARAAVARHYHDTDKWLTPAHVRQQRHTIRAERVNASNVVYDGVPGETGAQSIARRRALLAAVADGRIEGASIALAVGHSPDRPALPAGATRDERDAFAAKRLAELGDYIPRDVEGALAPQRPTRAARERLAAAGRPDPLAHACPACRAKADQPCRNIRIAPDGARKTSPRREPHPSRLDLVTAQTGAAS